MAIWHSVCTPVLLVGCSYLEKYIMNLKYNIHENFFAKFFGNIGLKPVYSLMTKKFSSLNYKLALNDKKKTVELVNNSKSLLTIPISEVILPGYHIDRRHERCKRLLAMCKSSAKWRAIGRKLRKTKEQRMEQISLKLHWRK